MKLNDILNALGLQTLPEEHNAQVQDLTNDSRNVVKGSVFVAIRGVYSDAHKFLPQVADKGAVAAIVEEVNESVDLPQFVVSDGRRAWSKLAALWAGNPSKDLFVYGITSTNGKTSMSFMLDEILQAAKIPTGLIGTVKIRKGPQLVPATMTTPEAKVLQSSIQEMKDMGLKSLIMEVSSSSLEQLRVADVDFDVVSFNNFSREHIDQHGSLEAYWQAKASLIQKAKKEAVAVLNFDEENIRSLAQETKAKVLTYSLGSQAADLYARNLTFSNGLPSFTLVIPKEIHLPSGQKIEACEFMVELTLPGEHHVVNAMAAIAMALAGGIKVSEIQQGLLNFKGVERRFERIYDGEFQIIDDHFANVSNIEASIKSLKSMDYNRLHLVYAIRGNRGTTVNRENIQTLAAHLEGLKLQDIIVTTSLGDMGPKDEVQAEEIAVFQEEIAKTNLKVLWEDRLDDALALALKQASSKDVILLAGSQGMDFGGRRILRMIANTQPEKADEILRCMENRVCDTI